MDDRSSSSDPAPGSSGHSDGFSRARRSWLSALGAVAAVLGVILASALFGMIAADAFAQWTGLGPVEGQAGKGAGPLDAARMGAALVATQIASIALSIPAARYFEWPGARILPLHWPEHGGKIVVLSLVALFALMAIAGSLAMRFDPDAFETDVKPFADMVKTPSWWMLMLAAAIGAPIAEEMLFRGILFGVLRDTRLAASGTILVTAAMWSGLHMQYSFYGMAAIFCIGLFLGWLRQRSGSLLPPIIVHGLYNGVIVTAMAALPGGGAAGP